MPRVQNHFLNVGDMTPFYKPHLMEGINCEKTKIMSIYIFILSHSIMLQKVKFGDLKGQINNILGQYDKKGKRYGNSELEPEPFWSVEKVGILSIGLEVQFKSLFPEYRLKSK